VSRIADIASYCLPISTVGFFNDFGPCWRRSRNP